MFASHSTNSLMKPKPLAILLLWGAIICAQTITAQPAGFPPAQFGPPLDIPLYLSGNFAEMRGNHFHTGLDMKTQGVEGQRVLAADEGVIARISVSPWGYGNALYIEHPNGYTTVYGHLQSFSPTIEQALRQKQYTEKSFAVDFAPSEPIHVEKGEFIAKSGNTGGSGGPHLHFEIRDTKTAHPVNPLLFGFDIKDDIAPRIRGVRVHPLSDTTMINGKHEAQSFVVLGSAGQYHLTPPSKSMAPSAYRCTRSIFSTDFPIPAAYIPWI